MEKTKLNKCLLIALVIGVIYLVYAFVHFGGAITGSANDAEAVGAGIATALVMPHLVCTLIAVVFNALGLFLKRQGFALVAGILYAVAMALFPLYFFFVIIEMILSFVGYSQLKKQNKNRD